MHRLKTQYSHLNQVYKGCLLPSVTPARINIGMSLEMHICTPVEYVSDMHVASLKWCPTKGKISNATLTDPSGYLVNKVQGLTM